MPRRKRCFNQNTHEKRLKEGRGQGDGANYQPYIRVQDISSLGQSNRDFGLTTNRQHDYLSKLEHRSHLIYDISKLLDIKEQKDIPLELSLEIARKCGIRHPADRRTKVPIPLTIDLVLTIPRPVGSVTIARSVKYTRDLWKPRVIEKLELERRSCKQLYADWGIITEIDFNWGLVKNILWSYKFREVRSLYPLRPDGVRIISKTLTAKVLAQDDPLCEAALLCDRDFELRRGTSLSIARHLVASGQWVVDMRTLIVPTERLDILHLALSAD
jgi:hypothetical protein